MNMLARCIHKTAFLGILLVFAVQALAQSGPGRGMRTYDTRGLHPALINSIPKQALDPTEAAGLVYMREEEKLAHDVYTKLYAKWGLHIFRNISQSELRHFDVLKLLLDRYELTDPAANRVVGVFHNSGLQILYEDLVKQGESSFKDALRVGATIEDLDLRDLEKAAATTDNSDLKLIYQSLAKASRNHLRAFAGRLKAAGESYAAQYTSADTLAEILEGSQEAGMGYGRGRYRQRRFGK